MITVDPRPSTATASRGLTHAAIKIQKTEATFCTNTMIVETWPSTIAMHALGFMNH